TRRPCAAYRPSAPVVVILVVPDGSCTICTVAPATGWPLASSTRPLIEDEVSWASTGEAASSVAMATGRSLVRRLLFIEIRPLRDSQEKHGTSAEGPSLLPFLSN